MTTPSASTIASTIASAAIATTRPTTPREKALAINLDGRRYGTFAEIGAGQEVVRWFFQAGGAARTIAKSISAYDMTVSDAIYGDCDRYVARERLETMLDYEQHLNLERLTSKRGDHTAFFTFADTVAARSFHTTHECHGWMGVKFQSHPRDESSQVLLHVRMLDSENALQQEALGVVGVNLLYGCCMLYHEPEALLQSLLDGLSTQRIEIDMVEFSGIEFRHVDNRIMSLRLVQLGLSGAAMIAADGHVLQPSEVLRHRAVLIERGRFRPVTHVNMDLLNSALQQFDLEKSDPDEVTLPLFEITMNNLAAVDGQVDLQDFISRAEVLATTGHIVMISDYFEYYRLAAYVSRYTSGRIGIALGVPGLQELFNEAHYTSLDGGILESFGRLFKNELKLYVYPTLDGATGELTTVRNMQVGGVLRQLYNYLVERGCIVPLDNFDADVLHIYSPDVLARIQTGADGWESMVPDAVADAIKARRLFGYAGE